MYGLRMGNLGYWQDKEKEKGGIRGPFFGEDLDGRS